MRAAASFVIALVAAFPAVSIADDALLAELRELEERLAVLEAAAQEKALHEQRRDAILALVEQTLKDADRRASLLTHAIIAGHDGAFFIADADGRFRLDIGGQLHIRHIYNRQSNSPQDDHRRGFEMRRMQLRFQGHTLDPRLRYRVQGGFDRGTGEFVLLDAEIGWMFGEDWMIRGGQFRPGFLREDSTSSTRQLAVERSLVNARFGQNRMQGIEIFGPVGERLHISGMISDGLRSRNTPWHVPTVEYALTGIVQWLVFGNWRQFRQFTSPIGESPALMFGSAIQWQRDEFGTPDDDKLQILRWTVDGQLSLGGASLFAAFVGSHEDIHGGPNHFRWGFLVQGALYLAEAWEVFARYERGDPDEDDAGRLSVITGGVNWYIDGHRLKLTTDVGVGLNPVDAHWAAGSAGWRVDPPGRSGQVAVRSQLQLLF